MTKSKQEWEKQIREIIIEPPYLSTSLSFFDRNKKVLEIVDVLLKEEHQRVVGMMIKWHKERENEWKCVAQDEGLDCCIYKFIDLQSKLEDK